MNVFACDPSPIKSAQWLADSHVVKMPLEAAQITSTALRIMGIEDDVLCKATHAKHPCTLVSANDPAYFWWTLEHGFALADEYQARFGRVHGALRRLARVKELVPFAKPEHGPRYFPLAMPDEYKGPDTHEAYRKYLTAKYAAWGQTKRPARWRRVVDDNPFVVNIEYGVAA